ncbi:uncharacterized protein LOC132723454 [Ruditapes philippinarum]|uniref:uncharacterized protein LOC132723454 n=1 Tax=Ruditapes philippinarum TaxID=129788 RepID=UPI00295C079B|nr:uncharacterized protein LOC132723454 [Ruditapes philippinarum]
MAVGGRKDPSYSNSLQHGCDFLHDFTCSPCENEGKNTEAVKFCMDCDEYLCISCLNGHNRYGGTKGHRVVDPANTNRSRVQVNRKGSDVQSITVTCSKHGGKVVDMFCGDHDEVCCADCLQLEHSFCPDTAYIPDISKGCRKSKGYMRQKMERQNIMSELESIKEKKNANVEVLELQKEDILTRFKQAREDMLKQFDDLEARSISDVEDKFQQNVSSLNDDIEKVVVVCDTLRSSADELKNEQNDTQAFVLLKAEKKHMLDIKDSVEKLKSKNSLKLDYKLYEQVDKCLVSLNALGRFTSNKVKSKSFSIKDDNDRFRCNVKGLCQLDDGSIVIADAANVNIIKLGPSYRLVEKCVMPSQPWSVCKFSSSEIAVSLCNEKSIQFVKVKGKMQLTRSFKVTETCTGLTSSGDTLFVGPFNRKQIQAYNQYGKLLRTINLSIGVSGFEPWSIATLQGLPSIYVASRKEGVFSVNIGNGTCEKLRIPDLCFANGITVSENGHVIVSCSESNKIFSYNVDGRYQTLLTKADDVIAPQALFYSQQKGLILASTDTDAIRVYPRINQALV